MKALCTHNYQEMLSVYFHLNVAIKIAENLHKICTDGKRMKCVCMVILQQLTLSLIHI